MSSPRVPAHSSRLLVWLASLAILFGSLAPSMTYALTIAGGDSGRWIEICTTVGVKLVKQGQQAEQANHKPSNGGLYSDHCPFCQTHSSPALLPPDSAASTAPAGAQRAPRLFYHSPHPLFAWASAHARAPPVLN